MLWTGFVLFLSVMPLPPEAKKFPENTDKWVHAVLFFSLFVVWYATGIFRNKISLLALLLVLLGLAIEIIQQKMHFHRRADCIDLLADLIGIFAGIFPIKFIQLLRKKK